ncbi:multiple sugar transport system permease protein [Terribacillus halophilus]|uniref:Multiple sugar transport system permease protein n=1 Tax=Terribacillus halophilus TaxID=361279 RepID=A0A1G6IVN1_9BACI|nr:sugar ABC transporter permease [Terribacillus halophilus]SDC10470.1 multiple sugar transport system permease protein [Terribacillus halophilus]
MKQPKKRRFQLSERQLGYAMVAPSIILIAVIIIWPIMLSAWNSLFDYRLNDPAKAERISTLSINLETYADNRYLVYDTMEDIRSAMPDAGGTLDDIATALDEQHETLLNSDEGLAGRYEEVNTMLENYQPVNDDELRLTEVPEEWADGFANTLDEQTAAVQALREDAPEEAVQPLTDLESQLSNTKGSILEPNFVGLKNYTSYLGDGRTWTAMLNTLLFTVVTVGVELIIGMLVALLINRVFIGRGLVRAAVLVPWAIPTAVAAMMWTFLFDGQSGIMAHYMAQFGLIDDPGTLLSTGAGGMFSVMFADIWKTTPYMALLLLAGLQTIPRSMYEAAEVDGANKIQQFFSITLPMIRSAILVAVLFRALDAFRVFDLIYVLTGGGPANSTESISVYAYKLLFEQQNFGAGSALSVIVFLSVALLSTIFIKLIGSDLFSGRLKQ